ncbi:deoxyribose-phosphate aldolase [Venturia canescens]|uniref:deoxyribose-phosphate aldolase n=1 Tax=Venturia canescens TaxID=32260 RepID=UPI001C9C8B45|nr:deoxyribose-phosphate aldolase [Venturia canescens]
MEKLSDLHESRWSNVFIDEPAVNNIVKQIVYRASTIQGDNKIAWLLKAITCIDLTTLGGDDTETNVKTLCMKAVKPIKLPFEWPKPIHTAAICVYPTKIKFAIDALKVLESNVPCYEDGIKVASVAAGFPTGQYPLVSRLAEIEFAVLEGADEIDVVIDRSLVLAHRWEDLYSELKAMRRACGETCMKTILSVGELPSLTDVYIASMIAMYAGSDFIKTSTGKEAVNATLPVGIVMCRAIRNYYRQEKRKVGFKPAGGIKTVIEALQWLVLVQDQLGHLWLKEDLFRIGASSLLDDIVKAIK